MAAVLTGQDQAGSMSKAKITREILMRIFIAGTLLVSTASWAGPSMEQYDPVKFEKRFHKADVDKNGQLSRKEAYAEFPRAPEFFDEIDSNKDNSITLQEVDEAAERRVNAAMKALDANTTAKSSSTTANKSGSASTGPSAVSGEQLMLQGKAEARREQRNKYYESLSADKARAEGLGEPVPTELPATPFIRKEF
jgi:hypothetical protein